MEPVFKVKTARTLPYGIKGWQLLADIVLGLIVLQGCDRFIPGRMGALMGLIGSGTIMVVAQLALFKFDDMFPGKAIPQYMRWLNESEYYLPERDVDTQPIRS